MGRHEILIIESRSVKDIYDDRFEAGTLKQILKLQRINAKHFEVTNREYLAKALSYANNGNINYVHISAHGTSEGFELTDGTLITWKVFDELAWPKLKNKCICFSSCSVGQGAQELFNKHKSFCNAIVAPTRDISWGEGLVAFSAFYHRALSIETSASQDVKVMNHIIGAGSFRLISSPHKSETFVLGS